MDLYLIFNVPPYFDSLSAARNVNVMLSSIGTASSSGDENYLPIQALNGGLYAIKFNDEFEFTKYLTKPLSDVFDVFIGLTENEKAFAEITLYVGQCSLLAITQESQDVATYEELVDRGLLS